MKVGDFVRIYNGPEAFRVEWINEGLVGFSNGEHEAIEKLEVLDLDKYQITKYVQFFWCVK